MKPKYDIKQMCVIPPPYGGVTTHVLRLIEALTKEGFSVGGYYSASCNDLNVINSPMYDKWTWMQTSLLLFKVWKYLKETWDYKIVHSHFSLEGMSYLWILKIMAKKKIVVTVHNTMNDSYMKTTNFVNRFFLKRMLKAHDVRWIAVSDLGKQQIKKIAENDVLDVSVIPAYIPYSKEETKPLTGDMAEYIHRHEKIIAFYGHSFMENDGNDVYGFVTAIRMYASLKKNLKQKIGLVYCISLIDDSSQLEKLQDIARAEGVYDDIYWQIGSIDNMRALWQSTDVYIRPTSTDGDSVAVREVIDEGAQVVASDVCMRPEGVITYRFSDLKDFERKTINALALGRNEPNANYTPYNQIKDIYHQLLNS